MSVEMTGFQFIPSSADDGTLRGSEPREFFHSLKKGTVCHRPPSCYFLNWRLTPLNIFDIMGPIMVGPAPAARAAGDPVILFAQRK